jgi:hypothetical protein
MPACLEQLALSADERGVGGGLVQRALRGGELASAHRPRGQRQVDARLGIGDAPVDVPAGADGPGVLGWRGWFGQPQSLSLAGRCWERDAGDVGARVNARWATAGGRVVGQSGRLG